MVAHDPSELVIPVRAGTPVAEVEDLLDAQGQMLAFEPPSFGPAGRSRASGTGSHNPASQPMAPSIRQSGVLLRWLDLC